ncbi:hypothetical protein MLD38_028855 [Melastoma candidum]|uniref:Uncharacterized protein n=1 Tax=Melastoma candidum TaxID=119954 RepID=A0ACB9N2B6_9MYRT|nr:hypothetical protein MLD38_028855 [Melastoma candidum]
MAAKSDRTLQILIQKSFLCLSVISTIVFIVSWQFVLTSARWVQRNTKLLAAIEDGGYGSWNWTVDDPSTKNRAILMDGNEGGDSGVLNKESTRARCGGVGNGAILKVYMYDLPPDFHFGLLDWKAEGNKVWPDLRTKIPRYPGGLNLQHSIEFWLTLDLLLSELVSSTDGRSATRVHNASEADVMFVPFFSSLSYNRFSKVNPHQKKSVNNLLQDKLVKHLTAQEPWKRSGGRDHVILAHHPNSMLKGRTKLWPALFILADFGRYPHRVANVDKDVIAPYRHMVENYAGDSSSFDNRPTLLYFQGAIYRKDGGYVRQELFYLLKNEKDVHFSFGSAARKGGVSKATEGMRSSKFCLNIAGDTPSSNRLFDAIVSHCVPVIISDEIELPYEDILDYSEFCVFVRTSDAIKENFLVNHIRAIGKKEWTRMQRRLIEVEKFFEYRYPSKKDDAVQMIWQAISRKVPSIRMALHKSQRFSQYSVNEKRRRKVRIKSPKNFWL